MRPNGIQLLLVSTAFAFGGSACRSDTANAPLPKNDAPKAEQPAPDPAFSDGLLAGGAVAVGCLGIGALVVTFSPNNYDD